MIKLFIVALLTVASVVKSALPVVAEPATPPNREYETCQIAGWTLHITHALLADDAKPTSRARVLLQAQLEEIIRVVPSAAVAELQKVPLWFSPPYPNTEPRAEYHPSSDWLRQNGRDPAMSKGVEFTNIRTFEAETRRMPNFALHELAHAYHDRVVPDGFNNAEIRDAYEKAKAGGKYDRVERQDSEGRKRMDRAYALTNPMEYFAESTEAFFSHNDFFPYTRDQLKLQDPAMFKLLERLWNPPIHRRKDLSAAASSALNATKKIAGEVSSTNDRRSSRWMKVSKSELIHCLEEFVNKTDLESFIYSF